ncbi:MAG: hypothetical protein KAT11_02660 [Phycisphaerae bacterium]|nr:hypothetical protein [Phycisphaerae bacterium]
MKKLIASLLLVVLVVPSLAWAEQGRQPQRRRQQKDAPGRGGMKLEQVGGKIVSLSINTVTIATGAPSKDKKTKAKYVKVQTSAKPKLRELLARGLGLKAQLLCRKTDKGALVLVRVRSIEGVEVPEQERRWPGMRDRMRQRGKELSPEQREKMRERFGAMAEQLRENPQLRQELRKLAKEDPEAFRRRIRQIREQGPGRPDRMRPRREPGRPTPQAGRRRPGEPMPPPGPGMGPRWGSGRRASPESAEIRKLEQQSQALAKRYRQAKGPDKEELGEKLRKTLTEAFELKVQTQAKQVQRLERQLEKLREQLEKRERNREAMIQKRFTHLTGQEEDLPW